MTKALSGAATKLPKSHVPASAAAPADAPPPRPAALAMTPESAARALAAMHRYARYREREEGEVRTFPVDRGVAESVLARASRS